jgi:hypothetical protein
MNFSRLPDGCQTPRQTGRLIVDGNKGLNFDFEPPLEIFNAHRFVICMRFYKFLTCTIIYRNYTCMKEK